MNASEAFKPREKVPSSDTFSLCLRTLLQTQHRVRVGGGGNISFPAGLVESANVARFAQLILFSWLKKVLCSSSGRSHVLERDLGPSTIRLQELIRKFLAKQYANHLRIAHQMAECWQSSSAEEKLGVFTSSCLCSFTK